MMKQFQIDPFRLTKLSILGISSAEKAYKLCWELNEQFKYHFKSVNPHKVFLSKQASAEFPMFSDEETTTEGTIYMIENFAKGHYLSKQYELADYFFLFVGEFSPELEETFGSQLKSLTDVQLVISLDVKKLKQKERFVIEQ